LALSTTSNTDRGKARSIVRWFGLGAGPLAAALAYGLLPESFIASTGALTELTGAGRVTIGLLLWMAIWWMTEAVPLEATSLLPLIVLPLTGTDSISSAAAPYASPLIYLFLGGFLLALSMQRWGLDRRIALLTLKLVGTRPSNMMGGLMVATAVMSAGVSNTATVAMMVPIAIRVSSLLGDDAGSNFRVSLLLSIAYAASIGGLATIIGSPPNGFLAQYASEELGLEITFLDWLQIGLPVTIVFLPLAWLLLTRVLFKVSREPLAGGRELVQNQLRELGPVRPGELVTLLVFGLAVTCWLFRPLLAQVVPSITDAGISIAAGLSLFVLPVDRHGTRALNWKIAKKVPWGVLILFGGGLSLAAAIGDFGVAGFIGSSARNIGELQPLGIVFAITLGVILLTELTSNVATVATLIPLLTALAPSLGLNPIQLAVPITLAASCAFMLPVATPPNAIVFGSGFVSVHQMMRAGIWLNIVAVLLLTFLSHFVIVPLLL
jgi:sodium-dependent dicarboxylate transporter 2/3/5